MMDLSERIKAMRAQKRWTQQELAERAEVSLRYIRRLEQEQEVVEAQKLYRVLVELGVFGHELIDEQKSSYTFEGLVQSLSMTHDERKRFWQRVMLSWILCGWDIRRPVQWSRAFYRFRLPYCPTYDYVIGRVGWLEEEEFPLRINGKKQNLQLGDFEESMRRCGMDECQQEEIRIYLVDNEPRWYKLLGQLVRKEELSKARLKVRIRMIEMKRIV